ncbi:MAG: TonB-dependent receptor [Phenylobacterium sp.]|nr:TonB-dependent receptor [Phenylobacterium sp.]
MKTTRMLCALLAGSSILSIANTAFAQSGATAEARMSADGPNTVEDIIVTAQRREERLQDVPVSISVVSAKMIETSNVTTIADLQFLAPGVNYNGNFGGGFNIRGVGTQSILITGEQSVGLVIDDVVQGLPEIAFSGPSYQSLTDIERIEVLKGPQGTLFGKNSSAGIIQIITKKPMLGVTSLDATASYATKNEINLQSNLNLPLGETAALRFGAVYQHRDGFVANRFTGKDIYEYDRYALRGKLLWKPTDRLSVLLSGEYRSAQDDGNGEWTLRVCGSGYRRSPTGPTFFRACDASAPYGVVAGPKNLDTALDGRTFSDQTSKQVSLRVDYDLGPATLTSITAYRDLYQDIAIDTDASPTQAYSFNPTISGGEQYTQEFRVNGAASIFDYTLGAFFYRATPFQENADGGTLGLVPDNSGIIFSNNSVGPGTPTGYSPIAKGVVESYALFGQVEAGLTDAFTVIVGGRYTNDRIRQRIAYYDTPGMCSPASFLATGACHPTAIIPGPFSAQTKADELTYKVTAKYDITSDINIYASYGTGYKGPVISNPSGQPQQLVRPELSKSYEIGVKSALFNRRVIVNADIFQVDYIDFQGQQRVTPDPATSFYTTTNAGRLQTKGFEAEVFARVSSALTLSGNVAYIPTKFTNYAIQCKDLFTNPGTAPGLCNFVPPGSPPGTPNQFNAAGYPLVYSPKWSFNLAADLTLPMGDDHVLTAHAGYNWRSSTYGEVADPNTINDGYGLLNGEIGYGPEDGRWRVAVFGRNLLDKYFVSGIFTTPLDSGLAGTNPRSTRGYSNIPALDSSRTLGVKLNVAFGQ